MSIAMSTLKSVPRPRRMQRRPADQYTIIALKQRDPKAFSALFAKESGRVYQMILRMVTDAEIAQNLVQETFMQVWINIEKFRGDAKISTWIISIALNLARLHLRRKRRVQFTSLDSTDYFLSDLETPAEELERKDSISCLRQSLSQLPQRQQAIIHLRDLQGYSTEETADALNISNGAVRVRLHRARIALKDHMTQSHAMFAA